MLASLKKRSLDCLHWAVCYSSTRGIESVAGNELLIRGISVGSSTARYFTSRWYHCCTAVASQRVLHIQGLEYRRSNSTVWLISANSAPLSRHARQRSMEHKQTSDRVQNVQNVVAFAFRLGAVLSLYPFVRKYNKCFMVNKYTNGIYI